MTQIYFDTCRSYGIQKLTKVKKNIGRCQYTVPEKHFITLVISIYRHTVGSVMEPITVRYRICNKFVQVIKRVSQLGNEEFLLNSFYCKDRQEYICKIEIDDTLK